MGWKRTGDYHARFHDLLSRIELAGVNLTDRAERKNFARSIEAVLPQFPAAWASDASEKPRLSRIMHTLNAVATGKQHSFNKSTEAAVRAGLAYHIAKSDIDTEAVLSKPKKPNNKLSGKDLEQALIEAVEDPAPEPAPELESEDDLASYDPGTDAFNHQWSVRERLMLAFMMQDQEAFVAALLEYPA